MGGPVAAAPSETVHCCCWGDRPSWLSPPTRHSTAFSVLSASAAVEQRSSPGSTALQIKTNIIANHETTDSNTSAAKSLALEPTALPTAHTAAAAAATSAEAAARHFSVLSKEPPQSVKPQALLITRSGSLLQEDFYVEPQGTQKAQH